MSEQVHEELKAYTSAPALFRRIRCSRIFGTAVARDEACRRLGLDPAQRYALFFRIDPRLQGGWIFCWTHGRGFRRPGHRLIVAGEFYASRERYVRQIEELHLGEEVILHDFFVPDADVKYYFSAADVLVQPYKTATQSGVTQIAYNFELPMIVTDVGGLPEIVPDGRVGYVCRPMPRGVADAPLGRICEGDTLARFRLAMREEKRRFSWEEMATGSPGCTSRSADACSSKAKAASCAGCGLASRRGDYFRILASSSP